MPKIKKYSTFLIKKLIEQGLENDYFGYFYYDELIKELYHRLPENQFIDYCETWGIDYSLFYHCPNVDNVVNEYDYFGVKVSDFL